MLAYQDADITYRSFENKSKVKLRMSLLNCWPTISTLRLLRVCARTRVTHPVPFCKHCNLPPLANLRVPSNTVIPIIYHATRNQLTYILFVFYEYNGAES
jgi:hypothetical protein